MRSRSITSRLGLRGRAYSAEDKAKVRQALIETGRHLFAIEGAARVSLRRIAAEAGYSPGSIYQYFQDHHALQIAIRELDMNQATDHFEAFAARIKDPVARACPTASRRPCSARSGCITGRWTRCSMDGPVGHCRQDSLPPNS